MSHDIESYCKTCGICTTSKDTDSKLTGLLHSLPIPDGHGKIYPFPIIPLLILNYLAVLIFLRICKKGLMHLTLLRIKMGLGLDFMGPLPKSNNFDYLLVVID